MYYFREIIVKSWFTKAFCAFLTLFMVMVGCKDSTVSIQEKPTSKNLTPAKTSISSNYTDREIFEGIVFFKGDVANEISYIDNHLKLDNFVYNPSVLDDAKNELDDILDRIETNEPGFFGDFVSAIQSGDQLDIENKLEEASEIARQYAFQNPTVANETDDYLASPDPDPELHSEDPEEEECEPTLPCENNSASTYNSSSSSGSEPSLYNLVDESSSTMPMQEDVAVANYIFLFNHIAVFLEVFLFGYVFVVAFLFLGESNLTSSYDDLDPIMKDQLVQSIYNANI